MARRIGLNNYVSMSGCIQQLAVLKKENRSDFAQAITLLETLIKWLGQCDNQMGVLDDFLALENIATMPLGLNKSLIMLDRTMSPIQELAQYQIGVKVSKDTDVLVVNHALLIMNAYRYATILDDADNRNISILVCDEADQLSDVAESLLSADLPLHKLNRVVNEFAHSINKPKLALEVNNLHSYAMGLKPKGKNVLVVGDQLEFMAMSDIARKSLMSAGRDVVTLLKKETLFEDVEKSSKMLGFLDVINDLTQFCDASKSEGQSAVISWSPVKEYPSLRICQPNAARILGRMWKFNTSANGNIPFDNELFESRSYLKAALFTSATMTTPSTNLEKSFDEFANSIGIIRHNSKLDNLPIHNVQKDLFQIYEPKKFGRMSIILADPQAPSPSITDRSGDEIVYETDPTWLDYCATMIKEAHSNGKRCLVLTNSFKDTDALADRLVSLKHLIVHKQGDPISNVLRDYVADDRALLITPSAWEGINLPGLINNLVISRIPFSPVDSITSEMNKSHLESKGYSHDKIQSIGFARIINSARRKLAQGIGRPIRKSSDVCTVWIADPRFPMPSSLSDSLDPVLMQRSHRNFGNMQMAIPKRFIDTAYENAKFCLLDGTIYTPVTFGD